MMSLCFRHYLLHFSDRELSEKISQLGDYCSSEFFETLSNKQKKDVELQLITKVLYKSSAAQLRSQNPQILIACAIKTLLKYSNTPQLKSTISEKKRIARYQIAKDNYFKLIKIYATGNSEDVIKIVVNKIHQERLWHVRRVCVTIIKALFELGYNAPLVYNEMCDKIEFPDEFYSSDIKFIVKVLYELLGKYLWPNSEETVTFLNRLLKLYYKSLLDFSEYSEDALFVQLRGSLELCVRHIVQNISNSHILVIIQHMSSWSIDENVDDNRILNYGSTLEYVAYVHKADSLTNTLTSDILSLLMQMIGSTVRFVSLLGNRVLQYLIDRGSNKMIFNNPKIFFEDMQLNFKISEYHTEDRKFFKKHREIIHDSLIKSIINHRYSRLNLETTYCTICLLAVEIPCGFTAAALCCLVMNLQDIIRKQQEQLGRETCYHIHAIIVSVLSFVCWIHEAQDFHDYVNKIVMERAQWAPHLNPPLQSHYNFAVHHVLWDKPELFFVDWEVRYGLWKRFRLHEFSTEKTTNKHSVNYQNDKDKYFDQEI